MGFEHWHLVPEIVADGATQMAIDTWLLDQLISGLAKPTLRFYRWQPSAISLGYHQKRWPEHWRSLTWQGQSIDLVRRPSGGRAVLHQGDLTYAVTMPLQGDRHMAYRQICDVLITAWQTLGVPLSYGTAGSGYRHQANCFALATTADLVTPTGYKLIGSAQLRRDRGLLQHGSIRLRPDSELQAHVFGPTQPSASPSPAGFPHTVSEAWLHQVMATITAAFERSLGISLTTAPLTDAELTSVTSRRHQFLVL